MTNEFKRKCKTIYFYILLSTGIILVLIHHTNKNIKHACYIVLISNVVKSHFCVDSIAQVCRVSHMFQRTKLHA